MGPEWTHIVGAIAALVAAVAAVLTFFVVAGAAVVAWIQLNQAKSNAKERVKADMARLMADLFRRWDEPLLTESRIEAAKRSPSQLRYAIEMFSKAADKTYFVLFRVPGFFEEIAIMTREGTISEELVRKYFLLVVQQEWQRWEPTIRYMRSETNNASVYEHFQWLNGRM